LLAGWTAPGRADLQLQVVEGAAHSPGTGSFDVTITNTDPKNPSVSIGGFDYTLAVGSGVLFTAATTTDGIVGAPKYIFGPNNSFADAFSAGSLDGSGTLAAGPSSSFIASDLAYTPDSGTVLAAGQTLDMGRIDVSVPAGLANGAFVPVQLTDVHLTDSAAQGITGFTVAGVDSHAGIGGLAIVPEPSAMVPVVMCLIALFGKEAWSRRRQPRPPAIA
jgi:hypothetical protein